jgi:hypothetical protein
MPKSALPSSTAAPHHEHDQPKRDRHGFRGVPPPAAFSLAALPDDALLTELETAAVTRLSTNTLTQWRRRSNRQLPWIVIAGGRVRYLAGAVRQFLASGEPRRPRRKPPPELAPKKPSPRRRRARPRANVDLAVDGAAR